MGIFSAVDPQRLVMFLARLLVLFTTMPLHESAHGWVAHKLGDDTAKNLGRLTLNPIRHLDPFGTLLILFTGFGWAKPVPVDSRNFVKMGRRGGMAITSLAGPMSNLLFAAVLMVIFQLVDPIFPVGPGAVVAQVLWMMISVNIMLAVFNLLPIPPLDGFNILAFFLPARLETTLYRYQRFIFGALFLVLMFTDLLNAPLGWFSNAAAKLLYNGTLGVRILTLMLVG